MSYTLAQDVLLITSATLTEETLTGIVLETILLGGLTALTSATATELTTAGTVLDVTLPGGFKLPVVGIVTLTDAGLTTNVPTLTEAGFVGPTVALSAIELGLTGDADGVTPDGGANPSIAVTEDGFTGAYNAATEMLAG